MKLFLLVSIPFLILLLSEYERVSHLQKESDNRLIVVDRVAYKIVFNTNKTLALQREYMTSQAYLDSLPCPEKLQYPYYKYSKKCLSSNLIVQPFHYRSTLHFPSKPVLDSGIVFHIYSDNHCEGSNRYMDQLEFNIDNIRAKDPKANIALMTNCDVSLSIANKLSVIVPIHDGDLIKGELQWYTRVLYNAYSPFNYSFILDTHVFPCYNTSYSELFKRFKESGVDISYSNRMNIDYLSGGAVLSKWGPRSFAYWKDVVNHMKRTKCYEDQEAAVRVLRKKSPNYTFKKMSSNWFYASHGISEKGVFAGPAKCYRSSIVVTGPVQWIHGSPSECEVMNGKNDEFAEKHRVYFLCGTCQCAKEGPLVATSKQEFEQLIGRYTPPLLQWDDGGERDGHSLYWLS